MSTALPRRPLGELGPNPAGSRLLPEQGGTWAGPPTGFVPLSPLPESGIVREVEERQSVLIICAFYNWEFVYSLKLICNPQINTHRAFMVFYMHGRHSEKLKSPSVTVPGRGWTRRGSALLFQLLYCKSVSFSHNVFSVMFSTILCFLLVISLFKLTLKHSVEMLSTEHCDVFYKENMWVRWALFRHEVQCSWLWVHCWWINNMLNTMSLNRNTHVKIGYMTKGF